MCVRLSALIDRAFVSAAIVCGRSKTKRPIFIANPSGNVSRFKRETPRVNLNNRRGYVSSVCAREEFVERKSGATRAARSRESIFGERGIS